MRTLVYRHLKLFWKSPANIVLSLLSSLVILSLYFLFIRDFTIKAVSDYGFISSYNNLFVDRLMISGLLIVIGATSVLSIIFIFVKDCSSGIIKDFFVTPLSYIKIIYSYFFASFIVSMLMTSLVFIGIELFFSFYYQYYSSLDILLQSFFVIVLSNIISSLLILIIALGINNFVSFSTFETLYGVVIGFFTGVYIPIGYYPNIIKNIFFYFPLCQTTGLLRRIQTFNITEKILINYPSNIHNVLYKTFGIKLAFNNNIITGYGQLKMIFIIIILLNLILIFSIYIKRHHR